MHTKSVLDGDTGEHVCEKCGVVVAVDYDPLEVSIDRSHSAIMRPSRIIHTMSDPENNLGWDKTRAGSEYKRIAWLQSRRPELWRAGLRRWNMIGTQLNVWCSKLGIPNIVADEAMILLKRIDSMGQTKRLGLGRNRHLILGAVILLAMRERGIYRRVEDMADDRNKRRLLHKYYRMIVELLGMQESEYRRRETTLSAESEIGRIITALGIQRVGKKATQIYRDVIAKDPTALIAKNPRAVAAACVYLASILVDHNIQQVQICRSASVSTVSLRNRAKDISAVLGLISTRREYDVLQQPTKALQSLDEGKEKSPEEGQATHQKQEGAGSQSHDMEMGTQTMST